MAKLAAGLKLRDVLPYWWEVARPWFVGSSRAQALRYVALCAGLAVIHTLVAVRVSYAQKHFSTALAEKNRAAWMSSVWEFVVIICLFAPIRSLESYAEKRMVAVWRCFLTQTFLTAYTTNKAYFHMQLARGTEDAGAGGGGDGGGDGGGSSSSGTATLEAVHAGAAATGGGTRLSFQQQQQDGGAGGAGSSSSQYSPSPAGGSSPLMMPKLKTIRVSSDATAAATDADADAAGVFGGSSSSSYRGTPTRRQRTPLRHTKRSAAAQGEEEDNTPLLLAGAGAGKPVHTVQDAGGSGSSGVVAGLSDASAQVDNPDQRITADVEHYVQTSVGLVLLVVRKTLNCAAFAGVLWSISPKLVVFLLSYALLGTFGTAAVFGAPLTRLKQRLLRLEADLRFGLVRLRENAEAIAFYGGDVRESRALSARLALVLHVLLQRIAWLGGYELWLVVYRYATVLIPSLVLAPQYFSGQIEFGTMSQASFAFNVLEEALRLILERMEDLSSLAAETARLAGLLAALRAADVDAGGDGTVIGFGSARSKHSGSGSGSGSGSAQALLLASNKQQQGGGSGAAAAVHDVELADLETAVLLQGAAGASSSLVANGAADGGSSSSSGSSRVSRVLRLMDESTSGFSVEGLTVFVPGRHHQPTVVCRDLSFTLQPGESLLIMGPSGCCKSSLLRIIAGLWTVGAGTVRGPDKPFFLPQKPFMPIGSLRQQLLFPTDCSKLWPAATSLSATNTPLAKHSFTNSGHHKQQQQVSEVSPLLGGGNSNSGRSGSSTAVKPSAAVQRLTAGHTRTGSNGSSSRLSFEPPDMPWSATAAAAAGAGGVFGRQRSGGSHEWAAAFAAAHDSSNGTPTQNSSSRHVAMTALDVASIDQQLQQLLIAVRLGHLLTRFPAGLDAEVDWASVLSLGEQQRVALVRLLFHRPLLAFMDESSAALDPKSEALVYSLIAGACSCYVSVGHRLQLLEWHSHVLVFQGPGVWAKYTTAEYKQRLAAGLEG